MKKKAGSHSDLPISDAHKGKSCCEKFCCVFKCFGTCLYVLFTCCGSCVAGFAVGSFFTAIWMSFSISIAIASLPLLLLSFLVTRILQFFRHGDGYDSAVHLKLFIRAWIYTSMSSLVVILAIFYGIAKHNPSLKKVVILGTPLKDWVVIYFVIFGIYVLNWALSVLTLKFIPIVPLNRSESGLNVPENVLEIIDCLIFWLALSEVLKRVHALKDDKILGLYTRKWVEVVIFVLIAYNIIVLCTRLIVRFLKFIGGKLDPKTDKRSQRYFFMEKMMHLRYVVYCANGLKHNIDFILISVLLLLTWDLYFKSHLDKQPHAKKVLDIVTKTFVSLLVCAFLWLIKTCLLLSWEVRAVYNRLESSIVEGAKQLYFLGILGRHNHDIFNLLYGSSMNPESEYFMALFFNLFPIGVINIDSRYQSKSDQEDEWVKKTIDGSEVPPKKLSNRRMKKVKENLLLKKEKTPTLYGTQQAAHYFLEARETLKQENYTSDTLDMLMSLVTFSDEQNSNTRDLYDVHSRVDEAKLKQLITARKPNSKEAREPQSEIEEAEEPKEDSDSDEENDDWVWDYFEEQLSGRDASTASKVVTLDLIEKWLERAHNNCLFLANTLASAEEGVHCLNNIISWLLIVVTFILWLLLTGFATTQVLVLIASPLLAATFIFGDSCKTLFQGIIFAYVVHPFDVGDLCTIEDNLLEVRTIGVWITTFSKVSTQEVVIYPNSELTTKKITNHKTNFDWNDVVELEVTKMDKSTIKTLKPDIEEYFKKHKEDYSSSFVVVLRNGCDAKITVRCRYKKDKENGTYTRRHKEKEKLNCELVDYLHNLVDEKKDSGDGKRTDTRDNNSTRDSLIYESMVSDTSTAK